MNNKLKTLAVFIVEFLLILFIAWDLETVGAFEKVVVSLLSLVLSGVAIQKINKIDGFFGLMMVRYDEKLKFLDKYIQNHEKALNFLADLTIFLGYGLLAYVVFDKEQKRQRHLTLLGSAISVILFFIFNDLSILGFAVGGLSFIGFSALAVHSYEILTTRTFPGVAPPLPGINLPFFEGILAIAITAIPHELCHGLYSRLKKLDIVSTGVVLFGIFPIAAFVELNDKMLLKAEKVVQKRIFVAGSLANMLITVILIVTLGLFSAASASITHRSVFIYDTINGSPAYNVNLTNVTLSAINGNNVSTTQDLKVVLDEIGANSTVNVTTVEKGNVTLTTDSSAKLGIYLEDKLEFINVPKIVSGWLYFIASFLSLALLFNFSASVLNLLPIFIADGYRILGLSLPKKLNLYLAYLLVALLIINVLPWFD